MKPYQQYTAEDFLNDKDFIDWLDSDFTNNETLSAIQANNENNSEINGAIAIAQALKRPVTLYDDKRKTMLFDKITAAIEKEDEVQLESIKKGIPAVIKYILPLAIAASYFIIFFINDKSDNKTEKVIVVEQAKEVLEELPDGSSVIIDGGSNMKIADNFKKNRTLNLEGRAFFQVKKGSTFKVNTIHGSVEVLGTSFTVLSRDNIFEVVCKTGKVKVNALIDTQPQMLTPNEKVVLQNNVLIKTEASQAAFDWQNGNYYFTENEFSQVVKELENQFNIKVKIDTAFLTMKYTGFFNSNDLDKALYSVTWPLNLKYVRISDKEVEIKK